MASLFIAAHILFNWVSLVRELLPLDAEGAFGDKQRIARVFKLVGKTFRCSKQTFFS